MKDLYAVLGVSRHASPEEIREAYAARARAEGNHPGHAHGDERLRELREAFEVLSDRSRRASYDEAVGGGSSEPAAFAPPSEAVPDAPRGGAFAPPPGSVFEPTWRDAVGPTPAEPVAAAARAEAPEAPAHAARRSRNPIDRLTSGLPHWLRVAIDWTVTIAGAIGIVLAIKTWVVNPYRIPSSSMEPTLHCGGQASGCLTRFSDRVLACRFCYHLRKPRRGEIVVFNTPPAAQTMCGAGGVFVKRLIGLPGDTVTYEHRDSRPVLEINGKIVNESYIEPGRAGGEVGTWKVPKGHYFFMGDNRSASCDSRRWNYVPRDDLIGPVFATYWPPNRISLR